MSKSIDRINEEKNDNEDEEMEEYESEENEEDYKNQYQKTTEIVDENTYDERDSDQLRIRINLEEIEERAPEEEESCISSVILTKDQKSTSKYVNNILILRKLLKYKNILYYYMARWRRLVNNVSLTKSFKKIKLKKKMPMNEYKIGDAIMVNGTIDFAKKCTLTESKQSNSIINDPNNEKIINNLKFFFENNRSRKGLLRKYMKIWKECVENLIKKDKEIEKLEQKYKNENLNIFEDINNVENYDSSFFKDNNFQGGVQRKELCVKKEITNPKVNKEIKKSFRIGTINNNVIIKFENNENGNDNNKTNEKSEYNSGINSINDDKKENDKIDKSKPERVKTNKSKNAGKGEKSKKKKEIKTKKRKLKPKKNNNDELKQIFEKINNSKLLKNALIKWFKYSRTNNNIYLNDIKNISDTPSKDSYSERSTINITNRNNKYNSSESSSKKIKINKSKIEKDKDKQLKKEEKSHKRKKVNNIVEDYNSIGYDNGDKSFQINKNKESIINNAIVLKNFKKGDILNPNKSYSPTLLQKYDQDEEYSISISNNDYSNDNYTSRKKSYVIEEEPPQVRQRRYTNGEPPKVQEHTIRMVRLTEPIKEIKDVENGNLEIRFAGEIYEIGTEITTYPTEITETITETTRIISEDTGNENKIYNETEEEITFQGKTFKRVTKSVEEDPSKSHSSVSIKKLGDSKSTINSYNAPTQKIGETQRTITSYITPLKKVGEPKRINKNFNTGIKRLGNDEINKNFNNYNNPNYNNFNNNNYKNNNYANYNNFNNSYNNNDWNSNLKKNKSQKNITQNEIFNLNNMKEKENDKTKIMELRRSSKELQNELDITDLTNKNNFEEKEFSNNNINYNQKVLPRNKIYNTLNDPIRESNEDYSSKTYKNPDLENRSSAQSIHSYKSDNISANELNADLNIKENKKQKDKDKSSEDTIDKKTKKLIKKYKKALNLLKKVIKSRKKRNKNNFDFKIKLPYYFNLFVSKSFPNGLEVYRQNKIAEKNKNENKIILDIKDNNNNSIKDKNIINKSPYKNKIKAKMIRIIDIIRTHRRKSRKLKIKLKEKNNSEKLYICFNLWLKNVFDAEDDKNNDEEELCETISSINGNDYYNDKNKKTTNRSSVASINSISSVKSNNSNSYSNNNNKKNQITNHNKNVNKISKNKEKSKIKKVKNNDKINSILKKFVLKNEKKNKNVFFKKWHNNSLAELELNQSIPYSKPKSVHLNEIQIPRQKIIKNNKSSGKLIDLKQVKKDKIIDINTNLMENGKKVNIENKIENNINNNNSNIITINTNIDVSTKKNKSKKDEGGYILKTEDREEFNKEEENDYDEEEEGIREEIKQKGSYNNNRSSKELIGNIYTRISNNEKKPKFNNRNIKIKKDENINIKNDQNIKPENNSIDIKDKLIKLLKKINDKTNLYFYFIKWHNILLFKANQSESKEEETVIVTPRRIISKIVKNFSPIEGTINSDKNNNLLRILKQKEQEILNDNNTNESLPFLKKNKTRIVVRNELSEFKKRSKTLLTHQKIGNMTINRRPNYINELDDEESYSERYKTLKPIKHYSNMNINSPKKRRILLKKKENRNISDEEESSNNNILEKENSKKNVIKTHIGNIIVKSKKIDDQFEIKNKDEMINTNVTDKSENESKKNSSKNNSSRKIIMAIKKNNNQKSEKKKIKKLKNKNIEKDAKRENEKENENKLIQNINDLSEKNTKMMNDNLNIIKNNKNFNLLDNNDIKEKYISLLKKHNYELGAYRIFYLYSLINNNKEFYRLKFAFKKWKKI